jgi:hypothetical protein
MIYLTQCGIENFIVQMTCYFVFLNKLKILVENVLRDHPKPGLVNYVPHGIDEKKFFPVVNDFEFEAFKEKY